MSATTVAKGMREIRAGETLEAGRVRRVGGGRKPLTETDATLLSDLEALVGDEARGDPESPLLWTAKSVRTLAAALREQGHRVSHETVARLLRGLGYSLQANRKMIEGASHPDRDAQFKHINSVAAAAIKAGQPVISVDTKKKELVGDFKNAGVQWRPKGDPVLVRTKDFKDKQLGKVNPYGVYDIGLDEGYVSVGVDADTAEFAVASIASWWQHLGKTRYPKATTLTITADCGGSNGNRLRLWKIALQDLADSTGLQVSVCHFPPGTSKWNKIEHRLFSFIARNWRGQPLTSRQAVVSLIGAWRLVREADPVRASTCSNGWACRGPRSGRGRSPAYWRDSGVSPQRIGLESVARVREQLQVLREAGRDRDLMAAVMSALEFDELGRDDRFRLAVEQMRRGERA